MNGNIYQQKALAGATGLELVIVAYDGVLRFLYTAIEAVEQKNRHDRLIAVGRVVDIFMYLQARLRLDIGGAPAAALSDFYAAMFTMTLEASHHESREALLEVVSCVRHVRDAWIVASRDPEACRILPRELRTREERYLSPTSTLLDFASEAPSRWCA
jgi:flagellar protein FliS